MVGKQRNPAEVPDESTGLLFFPGADAGGAVVLFDADDFDAAMLDPEDLQSSAEVSKHALGYLNMVPETWCEDRLLSIGASAARKGWGPATYDAALEWATRNGWLLTPGRSTVTPAAKSVWLTYATQRDDVESRPMEPLQPRCVREHHEPYLNHVYRRTEPLAWYDARMDHGLDVADLVAQDLRVPPARVHGRLAAGGLRLFERQFRERPRVA